MGFTDGVFQVEYNNEYFDILATVIHTLIKMRLDHRTPDFNNSKDHGVVHFVLGPRFTWVGQPGGAYGSGLIIGNSSDFLSGNKSLSQWIKK